MLRNSRHDRGDTLIEVLFAVTIFSMIVVGALSIMNQGTSASRRALETTIARQAIDVQAETLRFMHESYVADYQKGALYNTTDAVTSPAEEYSVIIRNAVATTVSDLTQTNSCPATAPQYSFLVNPTNARAVMTPAMIQRADVYPQLVYNSAGTLTAGKGLWIEALRSTDSTTNAGVIDFHIRACWQALGSKVPVTIGTIVRLYEPRG